MMEALAIEYARFTFIDLGSGKGRTLLMASEFPFRRVIGVELLPSLHHVALENAEKFAGQGVSRAPMEPLCGDARVYEFPAEPLVVYLFNPLPEAALGRVLENLKKSLTAVPREAWIVYHNPILDRVLMEAKSFPKRTVAQQYTIYAWAEVEATSRTELVSK